LTANQVLLGVGLIVALAVGSQVLASRLRIPALILLLPAGFTAGAITTDVNPQRLLGATFQPLVSLAVAVILYDAGMSLDLRNLRGHTRRVVVRLIMGVPVTLAFGAVFAGLLLGMSRQAAVMTGTILVVSGPTVVGPLLGFVRPAERVQRVLSWEGSLIDPVGGILGAVVFHAVVASTRRGPGYQLGQFLLGIGVGLAGGLVGIALLWLLLGKLRLGEVLGTSAQLASVVAVAAGCDILREDSGLIAVLLLTGEDDFNALGSAVLQGTVEGPVYRLGAPRPGHGVVAPYTGGVTLFDPRLTRYELSRRYADGARIRVQAVGGANPPDGNLLFLVRADGRLAPVTRSGPPEPEAGDTMILLSTAVTRRG
jgi:NhaP-type Na+/H+ or K+/H+ antiporter